MSDAKTTPNSAPDRSNASARSDVATALCSEPAGAGAGAGAMCSAKPIGLQP